MELNTGHCAVHLKLINIISKLYCKKIIIIKGDTSTKLGTVVTSGDKIRKWNREGRYR